MDLSDLDEDWSPSEDEAELTLAQECMLEAWAAERTRQARGESEPMGGRTFPRILLDL